MAKKTAPSTKIAHTPNPASPAELCRIGYDAMEWANIPEGSGRAALPNPFLVREPAPGVIPSRRYAMDDAGALTAWAGQDYFRSALAEGTVFMGYPYLAELTQRAEYRQISEVRAEEMTRKWIRFKSASEKKSTGDKIKKLEDALDKFGVQNIFKQVVEQDGFFGRSHIYLDLDGATDDAVELKTAIGSGRDKTSRRKIAKGDLKNLQVVEATWCYPNQYNANDPLKPTWYKPAIWFVMSKQVHRTRLLTFVGRPMPDILKPAYMFGGLSLSQMAKPYIDNWLRTRQSVSDLVWNFSLMALYTDLQTLLAPGAGGASVQDRVAFFNAVRNNKGLMMLNKMTEDVKNVAVPLSGLHELQAQSQEHMAAVSRIPLVKLLGVTPTGLNASSDGEIRSFYDTIHAEQESFLRPNLTTIIDVVQLSMFGDIDDDIVYEFVPLWQLDDAGIAAVQKTKADVHDIYVAMGAVDPSEVRQALADDKDSPYTGLDPDDLPDPDEMAAHGLEDPNDPMTEKVDRAAEGSAASVTSGV